MRIRTRRVSAFAMMLAGLVALQSCSLLTSKLTQDVPVTSSPVGATISVDGKTAGQSPLILTLKKKRSHTVRIDMAGYLPTELRVRRKITVRAGLEALAVPVAAMGIGFAVFLAQLVATDADKSWEAYNKTFTTIFWIICAAGAAGWTAEMTSGANHSLSPRTLDITLAKAEGPGPLRVNVIELDAAQLQDIQWIRIHLGGAR